MRRPWFEAKAADESFFEDAPFQMRGRFEIARPSGEVWTELTSEYTLHWCGMIDRIEWTSERPFGVGTTRTAIAMRGLNVLHERFFRWEEGRRKSFYVYESSTPLFKRFAEDYLVEPTGEDSCTFTWTIAAEPSAIARPAMSLNKRILGTLFKDTRAHFGA